MENNHGEYTDDIALENLKCSVQINWGFTYLCKKVTKELEVVKLAFCKFL